MYMECELSIQLLSSIGTEYIFFQVSAFHDNNNWDGVYVSEVFLFYG